MSKIRAAVRRRFGPPNQIQIELLEQPKPKKNEVLIKVHATTVSRTDCANLTAKPYIMRLFLGLFKPKQVILGTDFSGEVVALGEGANSFSIGDRVFGFHDMGFSSQAAYCTTKEDKLFPIPKEVDHEQAAASLEGAHYAYSFLKRANISDGQSILVNGATGGIGSALLQFLRKYDLKITATCNTKNKELIKNLGADVVIDYTKEDFTKSTAKFDFIFDAVGKSTFGQCKPLLNENGGYISSELGPYAQNIFFALMAPFKQKKVFFPLPYPTKASIPYITKQLEQGAFKPVIDKVYELENIADAYAFVITGQKTGNVVIKV